MLRLSAVLNRVGVRCGELCHFQALQAFPYPTSRTKGDRPGLAEYLKLPRGERCIIESGQELDVSRGDLPAWRIRCHRSRRSVASRTFICLQVLLHVRKKTSL